MDNKTKESLELLYAEVDTCWEEWKDLDWWPRNKEKRPLGYAVLFTPFSKGGLMIIGDNPGGGDYDFNEREREKERYCYAESLKDYTKTNRYYFTSGRWRDISKGRNLIDPKARCWTNQMIKLCRPRFIIAESLGTYDWLKTLFRSPHSEEIDEKEKVKDRYGFRVFTQCQVMGITLIGIIHPTGSRTRTKFDASERIISEHLSRALKGACWQA